MKRLTILLVVLMSVGMACSKKPANTEDTTNNNPTTPTTTSTTTTTQSYTFAITSAQETPAVANTEKTCAGTATIKFNITKTGSTITAATADFSAAVSGFPAGLTVTLAHIHTGGVGVKGGVLVNTAVASGDVPLTGGAGTLTKNGITVAPDVMQAILNSPGSYYFNVHSSMNPDGVVRGQLDGSGTPATGGGSTTPGGPTTPGDPTYVDPYAPLGAK